MTRDWIDYLAALGPSIIGLLGFILVYLQIRAMWKQVELQSRGMEAQKSSLDMQAAELEHIRQGTAQQADEIKTLKHQLTTASLGHLYAQQNAIHNFFITNIDLRPYFYEAKANEDDDPEVIATAEMLMDFFEHVFLQKAALPDDVWEGWQRYMQEIYDRSVVLRRFASDNRKHYGGELLNVIGFDNA